MIVTCARLDAKIRYRLSFDRSVYGGRMRLPPLDGKGQMSPTQEGGGARLDAKITGFALAKIVGSVRKHQSNEVLQLGHTLHAHFDPIGLLWTEKLQAR